MLRFNQATSFVTPSRIYLAKLLVWISLSTLRLFSRFKTVENGWSFSEKQKKHGRISCRITERLFSMRKPIFVWLQIPKKKSFWLRKSDIPCREKCVFGVSETNKQDLHGVEGKKLNKAVLSMMVSSDTYFDVVPRSNEITNIKSHCLLRHPVCAIVL